MLIWKIWYTSTDTYTDTATETQTETDTDMYTDTNIDMDTDTDTLTRANWWVSILHTDTHHAVQHTATHCNSLQLTATRVLQYTATPCNTHTQTCVKWCASISSFCSAVQLDRASGRRERRSFCLMLRCFMLHHAPTHRSVCFCVGPPNMSYPVSHNSTHNQRKKWHDTSL